MKKKFLIFLVLLLANCVFADGKMYTKLEKVNPDIPYQRALILHKDNIETLFLQSKYSLPDTIDEKPEEVGWIVPLPEAPDIATMDADEAKYLFRYTLSRITHPTVTKIRTLLWLGFIFVYLFLLIAERSEVQSRHGLVSGRICQVLQCE